MKLRFLQMQYLLFFFLPSFKFLKIFRPKILKLKVMKN